MMVPCMVLVLADHSDAQPALAGRLKAAAMQLLPPLLDGLHARRLAGQPDSGWSAERLEKWRSSTTWVSTGVLGVQHSGWLKVRTSDFACVSATASDLPPLHKLTT